MHSLQSIFLLLPVLVISSLGHSTLFAQAVQVRVLDAKSGARVPNEKVSVWIKGEKNARDYTTDSEGNFSLQLDPSACVYVATEWRVTCRTITPGVVPFVPVATILQDGFTDGNTCGRAKSETVKGKLIVSPKRLRSSRTSNDDSLPLGNCSGLVLPGGLFFKPSIKSERITDKMLDITVQVIDGRNGKPLADQHVLVFIGLSSDAVKTHAQHTGVATDKDGMGTLTIYPAETQWLQVFTDGRIPCFPNPNQASVSDIMSKGLVTPNDCSAQVHESSPGHFVIFARPAHFMEKIKQ